MKRKIYYSIILLMCLVGLYISSGKTVIHNEFDEGFNATKPIKVMTYNIRGGRTENGEVNLDNIITQIKLLDPDIIALQEVDYRLPRTGFQNQVQLIGNQLKMNYLFVPNINFLIGSYGNFILSKFPIIDYDYHPLPSGLESRGLIKATLNTGTKAIDVYATHLGLEYNERIKQISSLMTTMSLSDSPKILLGDFNSKPTEVPIQSIRSLYIDPMHINNINLTTYQHKNKQYQLDYIFYSNDFIFNKALTEVSSISDHNPLLYSISLSSSFHE